MSDWPGRQRFDHAPVTPAARTAFLRIQTDCPLDEDGFWPDEFVEDWAPTLAAIRLADILAQRRKTT